LSNSIKVNITGNTKFHIKREIMRKLFLVVFATCLIVFNLSAQKQCPGITVIGSGYDIFDEYANNKSVKEPLFNLSELKTMPADDGKEYDFKKDAPVPSLGQLTEYLQLHPVVSDWYPRIQSIHSKKTAGD
jgi:hypothetical protein